MRSQLWPCPCGHFDPAPDNPDLCECGHVIDEHREDGTCDVAVIELGEGADHG